MKFKFFIQLPINSCYLTEVVHITWKWQQRHLEHRWLMRWPARSTNGLYDDDEPVGWRVLMDQRDDREDDRTYEDQRKEGKVLEHHSHDAAQAGRPPLSAQGAGNSSGRTWGLQPLVPTGHTWRVEWGPVRTSRFHGVWHNKEIQMTGYCWCLLPTSRSVSSY